VGLGGEGHFFDPDPAVGRRRVGMQIAADVLESDELRQLAGQGRFDLAAILPQNGFHARHGQRLVDIIFGFTRHRLGPRWESRLLFGAVVFIEFI
jgi:hypothetical protein